MVLAENWETFIRLHSGEAGARDMFEKVMEELLRAENPGKGVHLVRASQGDGGIDVYVHQEYGIDVYQCKFFMGSMNSSRWTQVKDSFDRAIEFFKSDEAGGVKMLRWYLCMPREMQKEDISKWDTFCKDREYFGIDISNIDGNEIIQRMKKCDRMSGTDFISQYFTVPVSVRDGLKNIPKCLTSIPVVDQSVGLVGRGEILETIITMLEGQKLLALVSGLGGIGKTAIMKWICNDLKEKGNYVAWIDCSSSLKEDLLSLSDAFGIRDEDPDTAFRMIINAIKTQLDGALYLFMDNLARHPDVNELSVLNSLNAHIMVTSRQKNSAFPSVDLHVLDPEEALTMFFKYYNGDTDRHYVEPAQEIIASVGRHTLLVELLAKAAARAGGTLERFAKSLADKGVFDVFKRKLTTSHDGNENRTIEDCVMKLYEISSLTEEQQHIMRLFSIFRPEKEIYWKVAEWAGLDMDAVDDLVSLAWLGRSGPENNYKIHQIIKESLTRQMKTRKKELKIEEYGELLIRVADINSYMPKHLVIAKVQNRMVLMEDISKLLLEILANIQERGDIFEEEKPILEQATMLFHQMGTIYHSQGKYTQALDQYNKVFEILEISSYSILWDIATTYENVAVVYSDLGDYENAMKYNAKALNIRKQSLGPRNSYVAVSYNNMANLYEKMNDYEKAQRFYIKALDIQEKATDADCLWTATMYHNIAGVYAAQKLYKEAQKYYDKAIEIRIRELGSDHPDTALTYSNMAVMYENLEDYTKAQEYYESALVTQEKILGSDHPITATIYHNLSGIFCRQGKYREALKCCKKALGTRECVFGVNHLTTARTYNIMAIVYKNLGDYAKAKVYYEKALSVFVMKLGETHPSTQDAWLFVQIMELFSELGMDEEQLIELIKRKS